MNDVPNTNHLYTDLAWLWPMWGDHETEYARYCDHVVRLIDRHARPPAGSLLNISCGGGKNGYNLKKRFAVTGLDVSRAMLDLAVALNPECHFVQGDMRDFSLDRTFDAVLMDDGISLMASRADLGAAIACAHQHLRSGGVMVVTPDAMVGTFHQNQTTCTVAANRRTPKDVDVTFVENLYDPDPTDEQYEATMVYLIREDRRLRIETDRFTLGPFSFETWTQTLSGVGFAVHQERFTDGDSEYTSFACTKP